MLDQVNHSCGVACDEVAARHSFGYCIVLSSLIICWLTIIMDSLGVEPKIIGQLFARNCYHND